MRHVGTLPSLSMLKSLDESYQQIQDVLQKHNQEDRLSNIDSSVFKCLINFLQPFYNATLFFEGDKYPTMHRVYMWCVKLQRTMSTCTTDSPLLMFLKKRGAMALQERFEIMPLHKVALFLNPNSKVRLP